MVEKDYSVGGGSGSGDDEDYRQLTFHPSPSTSHNTSLIAFLGLPTASHVDVPYTSLVPSHADTHEFI